MGSILAVGLLPWVDAFPAEDGAGGPVHEGADGRLVYAEDAQGNRIPDFSNCGYRGGEVALPEVPVVLELQPETGDATDRLQAAIDEVSARPPDARGFRGAILLKKGEYRLAKTLFISAGGVVLRGEGQGPDGTVLLATAARQYSLIRMGTAKEEDPKWQEIKGTRRPAVDDYVPVGARKFAVRDGSIYRAGDAIIIQRPSTAEWIHEIGMDRIPEKADGEVVQWAPRSKDLKFDRIITRVSGNTIEVDAPVCNALDQKYGGAFIYKYEAPRIGEVAIENLRGDSIYHGPTDEAHGWVFIDIANVQNGWVRDVTAIHFGYGCVQLRKLAKWITVQDCSSLEPISQLVGERRYAFEVSGQLCLVQRCRSSGGRHDFVFGATVPGPNVFLDCTAENAQADSGPHQRWSVGMLFDKVTIHGNELNIRNRGNSGTGHGWTGANSVLWNCEADSIICESPPTAQNWVIGCVPKDQAAHGDARWHLLGQNARPASLYRAQLEDRLGADAVKRISR